MEQITTSDDLIDFLTLPGYRLLANSPTLNQYKTSAHENPYSTNRKLQKEWTQPRWEGIPARTAREV